MIMPTYDYICDSCGYEFDAYESIKADPQTICPECGAATLRRKIGGGAAILFKGSGFYQTDYRSDSYKKSAAADKPSDAKPASDGASGGGTKSESSTSPSASKTESAKPAASTSGTAQ
jgi:putative FmdB family regulatory protein